ncbi:MAG: dihydroorotase [Defluviitaleaceae bacterium]|nr:dihydroorotase [Defluviitaleaceae bacterium]
MKILIKGGRVIDPANNIDEVCDIYIVGAAISRPPFDAENQADKIIDATGLWITPGFIDLHVHLREPGQTHKEDMESGAKAAVRGGFTTICAMPNTSPPIDNADLIAQTVERSKSIGLTNILPVGAITLQMRGDTLNDYDAMKKAGMVAISEDGIAVKNSNTMLCAMEKATEYGLPVFVHCEDTHLVNKGVMHQGDVSQKLGFLGIHSASEDVIIARDIMLAEHSGAKLHICHISTEKGLQLVREAKARGVSVTAEVSPHHFTLCDEDITADDANFKMNPPLRSRKDMMAMIEGLKDGTIDAIATDHAPHHADEKAKGFVAAPFGIVGLETALPLCLRLVEDGVFSRMEFVRKLSTNPAQILGIDKGHLTDGAVADITIIDPNAKYIIDPAEFVSKSQNTPFGGRHVKGKVVATIVNGRVVYDAQN